MVQLAISAGHGLYVRGASGILDEVDEARRVVAQLETELADRGVDVRIYWDDVSRSQNENLNRIVDWHNSQGPHDLDVSVHFNAFEQKSGPVGTEVWYETQKTLAAKVSAAIADCGLIDRGPKPNTNELFFLNHTVAPAILIEVCFVDSEADAEIYFANFDLICESIADVLGGEDIVIEPPPPSALFKAAGKCSYFGGPDDTGVSASEGLAFHYAITEANQQLFLPLQPHNTTGLARRLNTAVHYVACRWDYAITPKEMLAGPYVALVRSVKNPDLAFTAFCADWGPHQDTDRVADLSPSLLADLGLETDDEVEVIYPYRDDMS